MGNGSITADELAKKLVGAKKVMNKVDGGNYSTGHINENIVRSNPEDVMQMDEAPKSNRRMNVPNSDMINKSKLPDAIKKAMIENPIPQISLSETLDMDFVNKAKSLMKEEGVISSRNNVNTSRQSSNVVNNSSDIVSMLIPIIENTIRKVLDEKLNQLLTAQQTSTINENLVLKVGDSIFKGRITGVNKAK